MRYYNNNDMADFLFTPLLASTTVGTLDFRYEQFLCFGTASVTPSTTSYVTPTATSYVTSSVAPSTTSYVTPTVTLTNSFSHPRSIIEPIRPRRVPANSDQHYYQAKCTGKFFGRSYQENSCFCRIILSFAYKCDY